MRISGSIFKGSQGGFRLGFVLFHQPQTGGIGHRQREHNGARLGVCPLHDGFHDGVFLAGAADDEHQLLFVHQLHAQKGGCTLHAGALCVDHRAAACTGGATGIALAFNKVTGLPVSAVLFVVNVAMLLLGWWVLGRRFALNTMASTVLSPFFMALWERLLGNLVLTDDLVLNTVFAGFGIGISLGITIRAGASTGGMDIPPLVLNKWFHLPVSSTMMVFDFIILAAQAAFSPVRQSLYGVVMAIIYTVVLDKVLMLGTTRTEVKIISAKSDEICAAIFAQLDRGVTILHGEGGYLREPESVLLSVVSNRQLPRLEKLAHAIDPTCFMIVSHVTEVSGRGFSLEKDYQAEG